MAANTSCSTPALNNATPTAKCTSIECTKRRVKSPSSVDFQPLPPYPPAAGSSDGVAGQGTDRCQIITHPLYSCHPSDSSGIAMYKKNNPFPAKDDRKFARRRTHFHEHSAP